MLVSGLGIKIKTDEAVEIMERIDERDPLAFSQQTYSYSFKDLAELLGAPKVPKAIAQKVADVWFARETLDL